MLVQCMMPTSGNPPTNDLLQYESNDREKSERMSCVLSDHIVAIIQCFQVATVFFT
jgi:hypothetical protein